MTKIDIYFQALLKQQFDRKLKIYLRFLKPNPNKFLFFVKIE